MYRRSSASFAVCSFQGGKEPNAPIAEPLNTKQSIADAVSDIPGFSEVGIDRLSASIPGNRVADEVPTFKHVRA
jgi:hypothetical protein